MASSICWNNPRETMTSAIWKVIERPWRTIFAPIFTSRSRRVVIDQCLTAYAPARANGKFAKSVSSQAPCDDAGLDVVSALRFFLSENVSKGVVCEPSFDI